MSIIDGIDREGFENAYSALVREIDQFNRHFSPEDCKKMRGQHGDYREYNFMHGCWMGWCLAKQAE